MSVKPKVPMRVRLATLLLPPLGLIMLWRSGQVGLFRKLFGTLGVLLYCIVYAALIIWLLMRFTPLEVEWRGGFPPVLTFHKTDPNYDAVEAHRARQAAQPATLTTNAPVARSRYWSGFRGPNRDGHYTELPIRMNWPATGLRPLWRQPVGGGYASFAIAEGRAFTIEQRRDTEAITCYDIVTGRELWGRSYAAFFTESMGGEGPRATPTYDAGRIYSLGGTGEFYCLDATTGNVLWRKNILTENGALNLTWAQSASPLIVEDKLIVAPGGANGRSVVAYHKLTGERIWGSLNEEAAYSSPMRVTLAGQTQLLVAVLDRVVGLKIEDGSVLWEFPWTVQMNNRNIAQPVILGTNRFLLSAGYGTGCVAVEVTRSENAFVARDVWRNKNLKNKFGSSVFWQGHVYGLDEDMLVCIDAETGARRWKAGRYEYGQVLLAGGQLIVLCGNGDLAIVLATPERHDELIRFPAIEGKTWNHPAIGEGYLLVRNALEMTCFDIAAGR